MVGVEFRLLLTLVLVGGASAFYLPGVAPHDYNPGEDMLVKVTPPSPEEPATPSAGAHDLCGERHSAPRLVRTFLGDFGAIPAAANVPYRVGS